MIHLGFCQNSDAFNPSVDELNKIGGLPCFPKEIPDENWSTCDVCHQRLQLLIQFEVPLDKKEKIIYVFACVSSSCRTSDNRFTILRWTRLLSSASSQNFGEVKKHDSKPGNNKDDLSLNRSMDSITSNKSSLIPSTVQFKNSCFHDSEKNGTNNTLSDIQALLSAKENSNKQKSSQSMGSASSSKNKKKGNKNSQSAKEEGFSQDFHFDFTTIGSAEMDFGIANAINNKSLISDKLNTKESSWNHLESFPVFSLWFEPLAAIGTDSDSELEFIGKDDGYEYEKRLLREYEKENGPLNFMSQQDIGQNEDGECMYEEKGRKSNKTQTTSKNRKSALSQKPTLNTIDIHNNDGHSNGGDWERETYENNEPAFMTFDYKVFSLALQGYPEQVVRWGDPLHPCWYTNPGNSVIQSISSLKCQICGTKKRCEFQLMPHILNLFSSYYRSLKSSNSTKTSNTEKHGMKDSLLTSITPSEFMNMISDMTKGLDFTTIVGYTCSKDCGFISGHFIRESLFVQTESLY